MYTPREMIVREMLGNITPYHDKRRSYYKRYLQFKNSLSGESLEQLKRIKEVRKKRVLQQSYEFEKLSDNKIVKFYIDNKRKIKNITDEKITVFESFDEAIARTPKDRKILKVLKKHAQPLRELYYLRKVLKTTKDPFKRKEARKQYKEKNPQFFK